MVCVEAAKEQPASTTGLLEKELQHSKADAQETLTAFLQFVEGVRAITRHMQQQTTYSTSQEEEKEDSKDDDGEAPTVVVTPESLVSNTCLRGTVFGTDLMRLLEAANHHVRDYAQMASEESALSATDVVQAQQVAHKATLRAKRAESLARKLARTSVRLQKQLTEATTHKTVLAREVVLLRQQVATARQTDMERLLEQHVVGALLLHEGQLKNRQQQQQRRRRAVDEEEKKEEYSIDNELDEYDDLELVCVEDCQSEGRRSPLTTEEPNNKADIAAAAELVKPGVDNQNVAEEVVESKTSAKSDNDSPSPEKTKADVKEVATTTKVDAKQKDGPTAKKVIPATSAISTKDKNVSKTTVCVKEDSNKDKENSVTSANQKNSTKDKSSTVSKGLGSVSLSASQYAPVQLYPGYYGSSQSPPPPSKKQQQPPQKTSLSPVPPTKATSTASNEKPSSSRSISSASSQSSRAPPAQEHVGSKVFNFLFHPEKIGQQEREARQQKQQQQQHPQSVNTEQKGDAITLRPNPRTKKLNPLLQLDDFLFGSSGDDAKQCKAAVSDDGTVATLAATTTPASSCIEKLDKATESTAAKGNTSEQQQSPRAFPNCVSFADDNVSVESNLQSPSLQPSPKNSAKMMRTIVDVDEVIAAAIANSQKTRKGKQEKHEEPEGTVELYKDLKVFHSLAIPTEDEVSDYHELRDQQQLLLPQRQPSLEATKQ